MASNTRIFKVDEIKTLLNCDICGNLLNKPVTLPCGINVCMLHLTPSTVTYECTNCNESHPVPNSGFQLNRLIQKSLQIELNALEFSEKFYACKKEITDVISNADEINAVRSDPDNYIYEYFEDIKREVDKRREDLKLKIDVYSNEIITEINQIQASCYKLSHDVSRISTKIDVAKSELKRLVDKFDCFKFDDAKYESIMAEVLKPVLTKLLQDYKRSLIADREYEFKFDQQMLFEQFFGSFSVKMTQFSSSSILNYEGARELVNLCKFEQGKKWNLIYRASEHGFSAQSFHAQCDRIPRTLTIVKATTGNVFGGYTDRVWHSNGEYSEDGNAFIFSLVNKDKRPFRVMCSETTKAVFGGAENGPTFGAGADLVIATNSNVNKKSGTNFGCSYSHGDYPYRTAQAKSILAGSYNFQSVDIEVWAKEMD